MTKKKQIVLFDDNWLIQASSRKNDDQWVDDVMNQINGSGGIYLNTLRLWFDRFSLPSKQKNHLKQGIESFNNSDHLGGVNELAWWKFINSFGWSASPVRAGKGKRPDFHVIRPCEFFCEVTTLNISEKEKKLLVSGKGVPLNHNVSLERILKKIVEEKSEQIKYGASKSKPSVLILFDYTFWSGLGTQFYRAFANFLLGKRAGFKELPAELSLIIYVERSVIDGRIGISKERSAVYHNPNPLFTMSETIFQMMRQYRLNIEETLPVQVENKSAHWFWL